MKSKHLLPVLAGEGLALAFFLSLRRPFCFPLKAAAPAAIPADETKP